MTIKIQSLSTPREPRENESEYAVRLARVILSPKFDVDAQSDLAILARQYLLARGLSREPTDPQTSPPAPLDGAGI